MATKLVSSALLAAVAPLAFAGIQTASIPLPEQKVSLHVVVESGPNKWCGLREAPHLIEHLLLSDTVYGRTPADTDYSLNKLGITLSALTHNDFTEYSLEGPASSAKVMSEAIVTFLGRSSIPSSVFEDEKKTIIAEYWADESYIGHPNIFEVLVAKYQNAAAPCVRDAKTFIDYTYDEVQAAYKALYTQGSVKVLARAPEGVFDLEGISSAIGAYLPTDSAISYPGQRDSNISSDVYSSPNVTEVIFPIAGRKGLPIDAAKALETHGRNAIQSWVRNNHQLYSVRSALGQALDGGWIRFEVRNLPSGADEIVAEATRAMRGLDLNQFTDDPVWQAYGSIRASEAVGEPIVAAVETNESFFERLYNRVLRLIDKITDLFS